MLAPHPWVDACYYSGRSDDVTNSDAAASFPFLKHGAPQNFQRSDATALPSATFRSAIGSRVVLCSACLKCRVSLVLVLVLVPVLAWLKVQNRFEGGLTGEQARDVEERLEKELLRAEALSLEADRHKEIADIASEQTLAMNHQVRCCLNSGMIWGGGYSRRGSVGAEGRATRRNPNDAQA